MTSTTSDNNSNMVEVGDEAKYHDDLAQIVATMNVLVRTYDPDKYPVAILQMNKSEWINKVENCSINATRIINHAKTKLQGWRWGQHHGHRFS